MRRLRSLLLPAGLLLAGAAGCDSGDRPATGADPAGTGGGYETTIRWTSYGVPHVKAGDWGSLGYGFAYATARDAVCVIARDLLMVNGALTRALGGDDGNLASDVFHKAVLTADRVAEFTAAQSERGRAFSRGYVAGYNRYLRDHEQRLPASCAGRDWVRAMDVEDVARLAMGVGIRYGLGRYQTEVANAAPPSEAPVVSVRTDFSMPAGYGSNAVAVGRAASATGRGLLLGNPHYPWHGSSRFHLIHTTIPGEVDVMGVSLLNTSRVAIGFNQDVAWSHTVSTALRSTLYQLRLHPQDPLRYRYGDGYRAMQPVTVTVDGGGGEHTVYLTHYGPVVASAELPWTATTAYAVRDANLDNHHSAETYDALNKASSIDEVEAAISRQGVAWTNTIAADRHGTAFYADISVTPNVDAALIERCRVAPGGVPERVVVLDGSDPKCEWREDARSAIPGVLPPEDMPRLRRDDYVANSNDSYWLSNPEAPLEGYSPIIGDERTARSLRTRAGLVFVREQLEADGDISADELQGMLYSHRNFGAELLLDDVLTLCEGEPVVIDGAPVDPAAACAALGAWDRRMTNDSRGGHVWREVMRELNGHDEVFAVPFDVSDPVNTPRGIATADAEVRATVRRALAAAGRRLAGLGIAPDAPLGEIQYAERNGEKLPIPGGEGWAGMWSMIVTELDEGPAAYSPIVHGNSYVQVISWDAEGNLDPRAILTYSQSPEPESPHYADMTRLYSQGEWIRLPFTEAEINADPNLVSLTLRE